MRAILEPLTLRALEHEPCYGYAIIADLEANGLGVVKGITLFPVLTRYESAGFVAVEWRPRVAGPGRKYFSLTDLGHRVPKLLLEERRRFIPNSSDYLTKERAERTDARRTRR